MELVAGQSKELNIALTPIPSVIPPLDVGLSIAIQVFAMPNRRHPLL